jgi:hypothetical protein
MVNNDVEPWAANRINKPFVPENTHDQEASIEIPIDVGDYHGVQPTFG